VPDCVTTNWALVAVRVLRTTLHRVLLDPPQPTACADGVGGAVEVGVQGRTFHSLRQYYASVLIRQSESVKTGQARLGHASAAETLDPYSLWPDSDDKPREAVDAYRGAPGRSARHRAGMTQIQHADRAASRKASSAVTRLPPAAIAAGDRVSR